MLTGPCRGFREAFEPGQDNPHLNTCASCRRWAEGVRGLMGVGLHSHLPPELKARLAAISRHSGRDIPTTEGDQEAVLLDPLPQLPLPEDLRGRLRKIPAGLRGSSLPAWAGRTRDVTAASCLLAMVLTLSAGNRFAVGRERTSLLSRGAWGVFAEGGSRGIEALARAGRGIVDGCEIATGSMGGLFRRISAPRPEPQSPKSQKDVAAEAAPSHGKENPHGNRPAH